MGTIKHPSGAGSVTPQQEPGKHVRGMDAKNPDAAAKIAGERSAPATDPQADCADNGPDARDALAGRRRDLEDDPGVGSSKGTFASGELNGAQGGAETLYEQALAISEAALGTAPDYAATLHALARVRQAMGRNMNVAGGA